MSKFFRQAYPLTTADHSISFIRLTPGFRWYMSAASIEASGYINDYWVTIEFLFVSPRPTITYDNKGRSLAMNIPDPVIGRRAYYSGIRAKVHFPPTPYREGVVYMREFIFSDFVGQKYQGYTAYLATTGLHSYQWETNRTASDVVLEEDVLNRDLNVWLATVTASATATG